MNSFAQDIKRFGCCYNMYIGTRNNYYQFEWIWWKLHITYFPSFFYLIESPFEIIVRDYPWAWRIRSWISHDRLTDKPPFHYPGILFIRCAYTSSLFYNTLLRTQILSHKVVPFVESAKLSMKKYPIHELRKLCINTKLEFYDLHSTRMDGVVDAFVWKGRFGALRIDLDCYYRLLCTPLLRQPTVGNTNEKAVKFGLNWIGTKSFRWSGGE